MEALASIFLVDDVLTDWFKPEIGVRLEELRVVRHYLKNDYLDVDVSVLPAELLEQVVSEFRHLLLIIFPFLSEEDFHSLDASLDIFHAPVLVYLVKLELTLFVRDEMARLILGIFILYNLVLILLDIVL